jgi:hypothetical protein
MKTMMIKDCRPPREAVLGTRKQYRKNRWDRPNFARAGAVRIFQ